MEHEPCSFLANLQVAGDFARTDSILAIADQPDRRQPRCQRQGRVLEDRSDLYTELTTVVLLAALPAPLVGEIVNRRAAADRAFHDAVRPAAADHVSNAAVLIGEIADRIGQVLRNVVVAFHAFNIAPEGGLVKSIFALTRF